MSDKKQKSQVVPTSKNVCSSLVDSSGSEASFLSTFTFRFRVGGNIENKNIEDILSLFHNNGYGSVSNRSTAEADTATRKM